MHPTIYLFNQQFSTYHLFFLGSTIISISVFFFYNNRFETILDRMHFASICFISGIIGSKLFFLLEDPSQNWKTVLDFNNGFVFYGSLFGTITIITLTNFRNLTNLKHDLACLSLATSIGMFFGKIGCFLAGCCYGIPTETVLGCYFNHPNTYAYNINTALFPVQLLDACLNMTIFLVLNYLFKKNIFDNFSIFIFFALIYSFCRFLTEYLRADISRGFVLNGILSLSQVYSLFFFVLATFALFTIIQKNRFYST